MNWYEPRALAELLGFLGGSAFAFWFRKQFGSTVSQWRRAGAAAGAVLVVVMNLTYTLNFCRKR